MIVDWTLLLALLCERTIYKHHHQSTTTTNGNKKSSVMKNKCDTLHFSFQPTDLLSHNLREDQNKQQKQKTIAAERRGCIKYDPTIFG